MTQVREPEFITPLSMDELDDHALDKLLEDIRERRLAAIQIFREKERIKKEAEDAKTRAKVEKQFEMLGKEIASADKLLIKLDKRIQNIRALKLTIGVMDL